MFEGNITDGYLTIYLKLVSDGNTFICLFCVCCIDKSLQNAIFFCKAQEHIHYLIGVLVDVQQSFHQTSFASV